MAVLLLQLSAAVALALAPSKGVHDPNELNAAFQVAKREIAEHPCDTGGYDQDAARALAAAAAIIILNIHNYPYPPNNGQDRTDHVRDAVLALERAFTCAPHWDNRHHLEEADKLIKLRQRELAASPSPTRKDELEALAEDARAIATHQNSLSAPPSPPPQPCKPHCPPPPPTLTGYAAWVDRLSLRLEAGGGLGDQREQTGEWSRSAAKMNVFTLALAPGVRFLAGTNKRHVVILGLQYSVYLYSVDDREHLRYVHIIASRGEYGLRVHPRWFSLHAAVEAGIEAHPQGDSFGREVFGFSTALCTLNEAICARTRSLWTTPSAPDYFNLPFAALLSFDPLRLIDHTQRTRAARTARAPR
jgi:hypothetical protein